MIATYSRRGGASQVGRIDRLAQKERFARRRGQQTR